MTDTLHEALKIALGIGSIALYVFVVCSLCKALYRGRHYRGEQEADE